MTPMIKAADTSFLADAIRGETALKDVLLKVNSMVADGSAIWDYGHSMHNHI